MEDTGVGIDEAVAAHVFEPFFTTKEDGVGTGSVSSTVYGIVAQSDGGIEVSGDPSGGTPFAIYLPVAPGAIDSESWRAVAQSSLPTGTETILLVEDEEPVRELVRRVLEGAGYEVLAAGLPSEAELAARQRAEHDRPAAHRRRHARDERLRARRARARYPARDPRCCSCPATRTGSRAAQLRRPSC